MTETANETTKELAHIEQALGSLSETAASLSLEIGAHGHEDDLAARAHTLQEALLGLQSDVQSLRMDLDEE